MWSARWMQYFFSQAILGPYIMTYAFSISFWVRAFSGFFALVHGTTQLYNYLNDGDLESGRSSLLGDASDQDFLVLGMANGVTGAFLAGFSEPLGLLFLELAGAYVLHIWAAASLVHFAPDVGSFGEPVQHRSRYDGPFHIMLGALCVVFVLVFLLRMARVKVPIWLNQVFAAFTGAAFGSHCTLEAIYFAARMKPMVHGLLSSNLEKWCVELHCKLYFTVFWVLCIISLITQSFVAATIRSLPKERYVPVIFRHPAESPADRGTRPPRGEGTAQYAALPSGPKPWAETGASPAEDNDTPIGWEENLTTSRVTWLFLLSVVVGSCVFNYVFCSFIDWTGDTRLDLGLLYVVVNAFCLWAIVEFFIITMTFHVVRLVWDLPPLPALDFSRGLPATGRTVLAYCLLSKTEESSKETFRTALNSHLANLDPNGQVTTGVISVSSLLGVCRCEMDCRNAGRKEIVQILTQELAVVMQAYRKGTFRGLTSALGELNEGARQRARFWRGAADAVLRRAAAKKPAPEELEEGLREKVEACARNFVYLHRTNKILKKPGQYQDLIVLGATGCNSAFTYLKEDYGKLGREAGAACFGFDGNLEDDGSAGSEEGAFESARAALQQELAQDIELISEAGAVPDSRFHYTMVLDSDTVCPPHSIRKLVETAEHKRNRKYGIINANLASDYTDAEASCTWHMWRSALLEVSTVNLQRGQFWLFDRTGFYGKGLVRNDMYIERVIGVPGNVLEALPIDILSHDTVEAKLLQPGIALDVTLYEDIARNPISGLAQSTRWMLGEVRNLTYHDGAFKAFITSATSAYSWVTTCRPVHRAFVRWQEVPCSVGAEYLSHTGMRLFHAGPALMFINVCNSVFARWHSGLVLTMEDSLNGQYLLLFVIFALFIIPKGFLILDKLPSCGLGQRCQSSDEDEDSSSDSDEEIGVRHHSTRSRIYGSASSRISTWSTGTSVADLASDSDELDEPEGPQLSRCGVLIRQLALALVEVLMSLLLFSPEVIIGCIRLVKGMQAQITGRAGWVPQDVVEKQVEEKVGGRGGFMFVFVSTWMVFLAGMMYAGYLIYAGIYDVFLSILVASWVLYPVTTYFLCLPVPAWCKERWLWTWVMDIKLKQAQEASDLLHTPGSGGGGRHDNARTLTGDRINL
eukprot:TRINITY_DN17635_c0_g2_i1.p1 TRINITY_DN17635_c0_g2~~TRINITY_DN17635_c0_g2_i1.p1  ORF type:complete len:1148 (-),score=208.64 TRINITY_DN17635_c0_g2_i1:45-3488(-)